jgi:hypothetical protein
MNTSKSVIANIVTTSQGAKVKVVTDKPSLSGNEILDLVQDSAKQVLAYKSAIDSQVSSLELLNEKIACLHNGGVRLQDGRSKDKQTLVIKTAFIDSLGTLSKSYKQDQWELFFKAVNSGKAIKTLNKSRNSDKVKKEKDPVDFASVLAKVYNHAEFDTLSLASQDEIKDLLLEAGYELPEA